MPLRWLCLMSVMLLTQLKMTYLTRLHLYFIWSWMAWFLLTWAPSPALILCWLGPVRACLNVLQPITIILCTSDFTAAQVLAQTTKAQLDRNYRVNYMSRKLRFSKLLREVVEMINKSANLWHPVRVDGFSMTTTNNHLCSRLPRRISMKDFRF